MDREGGGSRWIGKVGARAGAEDGASGWSRAVGPRSRAGPWRPLAEPAAVAAAGFLRRSPSGGLSEPAAGWRGRRLAREEVRCPGCVADPCTTAFELRCRRGDATAGACCSKVRRDRSGRGITPRTILAFLRTCSGSGQSRRPFARTVLSSASRSFGTSEVITSQPSSVTTTTSSMRMPIPVSSS